MVANLIRVVIAVGILYSPMGGFAQERQQPEPTVGLSLIHISEPTRPTT
mgnify:CR=1 FL=1